MKKYTLFTFLTLLTLTTGAADNHVGRAQKLKQRADTLYYTERLPQALEAYIDGLKAAEEEGDVRTYLTCTGYIGNIYEAYSDHASSLKYFLNGYEKAVEQADTDLQCSFVSNLVTVYCRQGDVDNARRFYEVSKRLKSRTQPDKRQYYQLYNQAELLNAEGHHDEAISMHRRARDYAADCGMDSLFQLFQTSEIGLIYLRTHRLDEAVSTAKECAELAKRLHSNELLANAYKILADAYQMQGHHDEAETYRSLHSVVSDSIYDLNSFYQLRGRLADYENEKINDKIVSLNSIINRQWMSLVAIALFTLALAATFVAMELRRRNKESGPTDKTTADGEESTETADAATTPPAAPLLSPEQAELLRSRIADVFGDVNAISQPEFSMQVLCELVRSNSRYVSHVIRETYHKNFNTLLNELRIAEAARRLTDHEHYANKTIQAIYEELGYTNAMSFNRAFKRIMGVTPSAYQKGQAKADATDD